MRQGNDSGRNWPKFTTHLYKSNCQGKKEAQTENMVEHQQESWLNSEMDKNTQRWQERKEGEKKTSFKLLIHHRKEPKAWMVRTSFKHLLFNFFS